MPTSTFRVVSPRCWYYEDACFSPYDKLVYDDLPNTQKDENGPFLSIRTKVIMLKVQVQTIILLYFLVCITYG